MNRRLILIISGGGGLSPLKGVQLDKENYLNFFMSPEGGAWNKEEIYIFDNNDFSISRLQAIYQLNKKTFPIDYFVIVYCGHGFTDGDNKIRLQVNPDCDLPLTELVKAVADTRCLFILDSCRGVYLDKRGGRLDNLRLFSESVDEAQTYRTFCRNMYDEMISLTPPQSKTILFADSYNETASEDGNGGLYSFTLLSTAKDYIKECRMYHPNEIRSLSAIDCHSLASPMVINKSFDTQHPEILLRSRSKLQFPFVVVPSWQVQI